MPLKIHSNYWDTSSLNSNDYSTIKSEDKPASKLAANLAFSKHFDTIVVGTNALSENLKVYQLAANSLIHLSSITLPDVHKLQFLTPTNPHGPNDFKFLLSGHSNGVVHLSAIPLNENSAYKDAEIIKRFSHKKSLGKTSVSSHSLLLNNNTLSTNVSQINLTPDCWSSTPFNSFVSLYNHHLFLWDSSRSRTPLQKLSLNGASNVSLNANLQSLTAVGGKFGIRLIDLNSNKQNILLSNPKLSLGLTNVEWNPNSDYLLSAVDPSTNLVLLWDIRKEKPLKTLKSASQGTINYTKWLDNVLWTGDSTGVLNKYHTDDNTTDEYPTKTFKISNENIIGIDYTSNHDNLLCLDKTYLSSHSLRPKLPKTVSVVKFNATDPLQSDRIPSCSSFNSSTDSIFTRRISSDSSKASSESLSQPHLHKSGDYLVNFQNEIDRMLSKMQKRVVNDIVYI